MIEHWSHELAEQRHLGLIAGAEAARLARIARRGSPLSRTSALALAKRIRAGLTLLIDRVAVY